MTEFILTLLILLLILAILIIVYLLRRYYKLRNELDQLIHQLDQETFGHSSETVLVYDESQISQLQTAIDKLIRNQRTDRDYHMAQKEYLTEAFANISHQYKTPLTTQALLIESLKESGGDRKTIRALQQQNDRMTGLMTNLLKIARLDADMISFRLEHVEVMELVRTALQHVDVALELALVRTVIRGDVEAAIYCDLAWTAEALANVIKNAGDASPAGGVVTIDFEDGPVIQKLSVSDQGPGIKPGDLGQIFTRFYRTETSKPESTGIGLSMAKEILEKQQATLSVMNLPEGGACFTLKFYRYEVL